MHSLLSRVILPSLRICSISHLGTNRRYPRSPSLNKIYRLPVSGALLFGTTLNLFIFPPLFEISMFPLHSYSLKSMNILFPSLLSRLPLSLYLCCGSIHSRNIWNCRVVGVKRTSRRDSLPLFPIFQKLFLIPCSSPPKK